MSKFEISTLVTAGLAIIISIPSFVLVIIDILRNRYRLSGSFQISNYVSLWTDVDTKQPSDYCRAYGTFHYVNFANLDFYITHINVICDTNTYPLEQNNLVDTEIFRMINPFVLFEDIHVLPRASGKEYFSVQLPKAFKGKSLKLKIFTSFRKKPFNGVLLPKSKNEE